MPEFEVHFIGDVINPIQQDLDFKESVVNSVRQCNAPKVNFIFDGFQKNVEQFYKIGHLTVIPSRYESFSMVAVESLSYGLPVVAPFAGGLKDIIDNETIGIHFSPGNAQQLADSICHAVRNYDKFDQDACINRSNYFSISRQANALLDIYSKITG
jgi:glycosyltransferase involved in cell wall biosynthesis